MRGMGIHFKMFTLSVVRINVSVADDCGEIVCDPVWCFIEQPFCFHVPNEMCFLDEICKVVSFSSTFSDIAAAMRLLVRDVAATT